MALLQDEPPEDSCQTTRATPLKFSDIAKAMAAREQAEPPPKLEQEKSTYRRGRERVDTSNEGTLDIDANKGTADVAASNDTVDKNADPFRIPTSPGLSALSSQARRMAPRVHVGCKRWTQVHKLCQDTRRGHRQITVKAQANLHDDQDVVLALKLPDEMVLSMMARVIRANPSNDTSVGSFLLEMVGFGEEQIAYLLDCCAKQGVSGPSVGAAGTPTPTKSLLEQRQQAARMPAARPTPAPNSDIPECIESVEDEEVPSYEPRISWD